jgi:nucleotide-binding universal stress UspA family protein
MFPLVALGTRVAFRGVQMKIVCATDFGLAGANALKVASSLSRWSGGSLEIVNVVPLRAVDARAVAADAAVLDREVRERALRRVDELVGVANEAGVLDVRSTILEGEPDAAILEHARQVGADLVVMGAHSRSALERAVLGSSAARTVRRATLPVLIVPAGAAAWGPRAGAPRLSVVVAVEGGAASAGPIDVARRLREQIACDVTVLRLYWPPEEYRRLGLTGARSLVAPDPDVVADLERGLRKLVGTLPGAGATTFVVQPAWGEPAGALLEAAHERGCDLMIVGTESRHGLGRLARPAVAEHVAREATDTPVLFVPPREAAPRSNELPRIGSVLAATDLSALGNRAVPYAYSLVAPGGVVELCYVHARALPSPAYAYDRPEGALDDAHRAQIAETLRALVPTDAERAGIGTHVTVVDGGRAGEAIVQTAERLAVDAIVLGSHGRGRVAQVVVGSVAETVVRTAHRPVLVVPAPKP